MRKLKLQVQMSVDGFMGGPKGELDWMVWNWDQKLKDYVRDITDPVDTIVIGRKLAEGFIPYWASHAEQEGADKINGAKKIVFTKTLQKSQWERAELAKGDIIEEISKLKNQAGGDIIAYGGATFVSALIQNGLIDDLHLFVNPVAIGNGLTIFNNINAKQKLLLKKSTSFECGIVVLHYEPKAN